ncbi:MAG: amidohydrolase family protein [Steroidobacteraceae bacterium]|jgi:cytosine/adenosine deaminase-related metal-dependent hydrolase|nr:amidohydrolase family protein [Steroidobacteraceae bacterium]
MEDLDEPCGCFATRTPGEPGPTRRGVVAGLATAGLALAGRAQAATPASAPARRLTTPLPRRHFVLEAGAALVSEGGGSALRRDVSIVVDDGAIVEWRAGRMRGRLPRVDAGRLLVVPGWISGHTHVAGGTVTRGLFEGRRSYARPLELVERLDDESLDAITALNLAELLRSGCTTQVEMSLSLRQAQSYVRVARRWGVRGYPAGMIPGVARLFPIWQRRDDAVLRESVPGTLAEIEANLAWARTVDGAEGGLIRPMIAPHAADTHTPETLRAVLAAARQLGHGIHLHLCQGRGETEAVRRAWGLRPVEWLGQLGLFEERVFGAHLSAPDLVNDPAILKRHRFTYVTCPSGGGASGFTQPWPELLAAGVNTNVGIDTHSNDYIENLKLAVLKGEARWSLARAASPVPMTRPTIAMAVDAATLGAARGLGRDDLGRIAPGARADLCAIDVSGWFVGSGALPPEPLTNLLYASGLAVRHVMTDGRFQVHDGLLVVDDEAQVMARAGAVVERLWDQLRAERYFDDA